MASVSRNNKSDLGYLGSDFQYKLIAAFLRDPDFFKDFNSIIDQNMFTEPCLRTTVGVMKDYYEKYDSVPDYEMILIKLRSRTNNEDDIQYYEEIVDKLRNTTYAGHEEIEHMAEKFFKQQNWVKVANQILRTVGDGDLDKYDALEDMIEKAHSIGRHDHNVYNVFDDLDETLSEEAVTMVPTGINGLDEILGGGLEKGKLGLIICPMGMGKTSMTTCISANAAMTRCKQNNYSGYKVLQICFEDKPRDLRRKYIGKLTQIEARELSKSNDIVEKIKERLGKGGDLNEMKELLSSNVRIEKLKTGEVTATQIKEKIIKHINEGFYPDLVIIDYFECVEPESGSNKNDVTEKEGRTMRKFETMADELNIAVWIPSQGNRESITAELVTNDKVGGSIRKNQIAQVIVSIARPNPEDMERNLATIAILKNRSGLSGKVFNNVSFNNGTCTIQTDVNGVDFNAVVAFNDDGDSGICPKRKVKYADKSGNEFDTPEEAKKSDDNIPQPVSEVKSESVAVVNVDAETWP